MSLGAQRAGRRVARTRMVLYLSLRAVARAMQTMSRAGPKSTSANLRALLASLCALYCVLPQPSWAGRPVRVYKVDVEGQSGPALQDAMRQALVRATGRRESADDPALASVVADATRYVKNYAVGPRGESQVVRSEEHMSELQSRSDLVCRLLLEKKKKYKRTNDTCE